MKISKMVFFVQVSLFCFLNYALAQRTTIEGSAKDCIEKLVKQVLSKTNWKDLEITNITSPWVLYTYKFRAVDATKNKFTGEIEASVQTGYEDPRTGIIHYDTASCYALNEIRFPGTLESWFILRNVNGTMLVRYNHMMGEGYKPYWEN